MGMMARFKTSAAPTFLSAVLLSIVSAGCSRAVEPSDAPAADEKIVFFPSLASVVPGGQLWSVSVQGRIFRPAGVSKERTLLIEAIAKAFDLDDNDAKSALFDQRASYFLSISEPNRRVSVKIGAHTLALPPSDSGGYFEGEIQLPSDEAAKLANAGVMSYESVPTAVNASRFSGTARLAPEEGLSVVTDMDDTIKVTNVLNRTEMLKNTLVRPFTAVAGMPALYRSWQEAGGEHILFHVVSAGPWQFNEPLRQFTKDFAFPDFSWHMRSGLKPTNPEEVMQELKPNPEPFKISTIEVLMRRFPKRHFVCVGDSGERDPEVYSRLLRDFPNQVDAVFIHNVTHKSEDVERFKNLFPGQTAVKLRVFDDPTELPPLAAFTAVR